MARLRVLYVVDGFGLGGTRTVLLAQVARLPPESVEVAILTLSDDARVGVGLVPPHVQVISAPFRGDRGYTVRDYLADSWLLLSARKWGGEALRAIERFKPDVLHFHTNPRELALGVLARRASPVALVFTDHLVRVAETDYTPQIRFLLRVAYRRLYRQYNLISVGQSVAESNRAAGFVGAGRRHVVMRNQVDIERFRPPEDGRRADPLEIIYVGRIHPIKRVDTVVRAFGQAHAASPVRLLIVGPDEMGGEIQRLAAECVEPPKSVLFLGERTDVPELLRQASISLLMSEREGQPLALLEQMASGLAVVASNIPESAELISDGVSGRLVAVDDVAGCAAVLGELILDGELRARIGRAARQAVEERGSMDDSGVLMELYTEVTRRR